MAVVILEEHWRPDGVVRDILIDSVSDLADLPQGSLPGSMVSTAAMDYIAQVGADGELHQIGGT